MTSDSTRQVVLSSDTGSFVAKLVSNAAMSDITVSTAGTVAGLFEDGVYQFACRDTARYVQVQYDSDGTGTSISAVFIAEDLDRAPNPGATSAY